MQKVCNKEFLFSKDEIVQSILLKLHHDRLHISNQESISRTATFNKKEDLPRINGFGLLELNYLEKIFPMIDLGTVVSGYSLTSHVSSRDCTVVAVDLSRPAVVQFWQSESDTVNVSIVGRVPPRNRANQCTVDKKFA